MEYGTHSYGVEEGHEKEHLWSWCELGNHRYIVCSPCAALSVSGSFLSPVQHLRGHEVPSVSEVEFPS